MDKSASMGGEVLYELTEIIKQQTQIQKDPLRALKLKTFPEKVAGEIERSCPWKVAVHEMDKLLAVLLQTGDIDIYDFTGQDVDLIGRSKVLSDGNVEWSHLKWSQSGTLLLFVRCTPIIDVMDVAGNPCYSIPLENTLEVNFEPYLSVSHIQVESNTGGKWCDRLYVLQYCGNISCYDIGRLNGFHPIFRTELAACIERGLASQFVLLPDVNLLIVSLLYRPHALHPETLTCCHLGVRSFRLLDAKPHFMAIPLAKEEEAFEELQKSTWITRFFDAIPFIASEKACIVSMSVNRGASKLAVLSTTSDLVVFSCPSLKPVYFCIADRTKSRIPHFSSVGWWSDEELIVHRNDGSVFIVACDNNLESSLRPTAQPSHAFLPWSQTTLASKGLAFVLETSIKDEQVDDEEGKVLLVVKMSLIAAYGWIKLMLGWAVGQPLHEVSRPSPEALAMRKIEIKLNELRGFTPEEMFRKKLVAEEFGEALALAKVYNIDSDIVFRQQWRINTITKHTIRDYLRKVKNVDWVLNECLERIPESDEICAQLLNLGLQLASVDHINPHSISLVDRNTCQIRVKLLHYLTVLDDYQAIQRKVGGTFDPNVYRNLRSFSLLHMALYLARTGQCEALLIVLQRHKNVLYEHWLCILNNIPEVISVEEYKQLLPKVNNGSVKSWTAHSASRKPDKIETDDFKNALINVFQSFVTQTDMYHMSPALNDFRLVPDCHEMQVVIGWLRRRALQIEDETSLPSLTQHFLHAAVQLGFTDLSDLEKDASAYAKFVNDTGDTTVSLATFQSANPAHMVETIVHQATRTEPLSVLEGKVLPYLKHCESFSRCRAKETFFLFIQSQSVHSLQLVSKIISASSRKGFTRTTRAADELTLNLNVMDAVTLVESCLLACEYLGDKLIVPATQLLNFLRQGEKDFKDSERKTMNRLDGYLKALSTLEYYGVNCTMLHLHKCHTDAKASEALVVQCMRKATIAKDNVVTANVWNVIEWQRLNNDLLQLVDAALPLLHANTCQKLFVSGLLSSDNHSIIAYAPQFCSTHPADTKAAKSSLPFSLTVELVLSASRDYIQAAEKASDPLLSLARACLELIQDPKPLQVKRDLDMIAALPVLEQLGLHELPVRICIAPDRLQYVEKALSSNKANYKEAKRLLKVSDFLSSDISKQAECERHGRILTQCARQALECDDFSQAAKYCRQLKSQYYSSAWQCCRDVVIRTMPLRTLDVNIAIELLSFAILHCIPKELPELMGHLKKLKQNALLTQLGEQLDEKHNGDNTDTPVHTGIENVLKKHMLASAGMVKVGLDTFKNLSSKLVLGKHQKTASTPLFLTPKLDPIYVPVRNLQLVETTDHLEDLSDDLMSLATQLRLFLLADAAEVDDDELVEVLTRLAQALLHESLSWFMAVLLILVRSDAALDTIVDPYKSNDTLIQILLYYYSILICAHADGKQRGTILRLPAEKLVEKCSNIDNRSKLPFADQFLHWADVSNQKQQQGLLAQVSSDIDVARFTKEEEYRKDTIVGMALCIKEESYAAALDLAKQHDIAEFDVVFAHLEYILTESRLPITEMQALIKSRKIVSTLSKNPQRMYKDCSQKILPLLEANNGSLLLLYFLMIEKGCASLPQSAHAQAHRSVLRHLMKLAPDLDYRTVMDETSNMYDVLKNHVNARNVENLAKALSKVPNRAITPSQVMCVWAVKIFQDRLSETGVVSSCKASFKVVDEVTADDFVHLLEHVVDSTDKLQMSPKQTLQFLETSLDHAQSTYVKEAAVVHIKQLIEKYREKTMDENEKVMQQAKISEVVKEEKKIAVSGMSVNELGKEGREELDKMRVHPALRTHSAAMYVLRKRK